VNTKSSLDRRPIAVDHQLRQLVIYFLFDRPARTISNETQRLQKPKHSILECLLLICVMNGYFANMKRLRRHVLTRWVAPH